MKYLVEHSLSVNLRTAKSGEHQTQKTLKVAQNSLQQLDFDGLL